jgi:cobalt-precorrin 5A hydrolase
MKGPVALVAVSETGAALSDRIASALTGLSVDAFVLAKYAKVGHESFENTAQLTASLWDTHRCIVFLCASGIAVRSIAPLVRSKFDDPAVLVTGDRGAFVISLLSGHEGGANEAAFEIAACIGSVPVITTASECSPPVLPRNLYAGIGCKRGTDAAAIHDFVAKVFACHKLSPHRIRAICTIDINRDEKGLEEFSERIGAPLLFFDADSLNVLPGNFSGSDYVKDITGTDNVCERAAVKGAAGMGTAIHGTANGRLIIKKTAENGITLAVFEKDATINVEKGF